MHATNRRSVLIVDADDRWARPLAYEMSQLGLEPAIARSAKEAFELLSRARFVLMFSELRLVDYSGLDLMRVMKAHGLPTATILMSADASASEYKRAIQEGAIDILVKPFSREELKEAVQKSIDVATGSKSIIHRLNLIDLLQIMHLGARSIRVKVSPGNGVIHMVRGEIVHAEYGALSSVDALRMMLASEPGSIETLPAVDVPETISASFEMLLMELMRQIDEARHGGPQATHAPVYAARPRANSFSNETPKKIPRFDFREMSVGAGILVALVLALVLVGVGIVGKELSAAPSESARQ